MSPPSRSTTEITTSYLQHSPRLLVLLQAYRKKAEQSGPVPLVRTGCDVAQVRDIIRHVLETSNQTAIRFCAMAVFSYRFQLRSVSITNIAPNHITVLERGSAKVVSQNGQRAAHGRPLFLTYPAIPDCEVGSGPHDLLLHYFSIRS